jgi:DNA-binding response OmpR family regulator
MIPESMPATILVVDDQPDFVELISHSLMKAGHSIVTAVNGREALECAIDFHPDAIVLDVMLPEMDGLSVCEMLRRIPSTRDIPVLILSACASAESRQLGLEVGADEYVAKPFSPRELVGRVARLLDVKHSSGSHRQNPA